MTEEEFDELRRSAFAIAYRMLGSVSEAEDVVQEGFLRLHRAREGGERIASPRAYLSTVVSRLSLDQLRSARVRRETYVGEWLAELLAHDVVLRGDGGGKAPALARALHGRARVARTLIAWLRTATRFGVTWRREEVNGQPGALFFDREGRLVSVMSLDVAEGQIQGVSGIVNPDKLGHLGRWPTWMRCCASGARFFSSR